MVSTTAAPPAQFVSQLSLWFALPVRYNPIMKTPETGEQRRARYAAYSRARRVKYPEEWKRYHDPKKHLAEVKAAYAADPEKYRARKREYYAANKEKFKERNKAAHRAAYLAKPEHYYAKCAQRRAIRLQRTPAWSETEQIRAFYAACPPNATVDHWMPMQGKTVSGLHVLANLQYLTETENKGKFNKLPHNTLPRFVASKWIQLMLARFYAAQRAEEVIAA